MPEGELLEGALHDRHVALEARMGDEAGWDVPLSYLGPVEEAGAVRRRAGVFDVSHCGRIRIRGDGALALLERACTADVAHQEEDAAVATLLCNAAGGVIDACRLLRMEGFWVLVTSPPARQRVLGHLQGLAEGLDARVDDQTVKTCQLAVCGPAAGGILDAVLPMRVSDLPEGAARTGSLLIARYIAMRVSPTGQWALQVILPNLAAGPAWDFITRKAGSNAVAPAGAVALDVLRIEAGLPRWGHEINETIDPVTLGLEGLVDTGHGFIGREAFLRSAARGARRKRVGLVIPTAAGEARASDVPRLGSAVRRGDGGECGAVTSATYSPALRSVIAMAYVSADAAETGAELTVLHGERELPARVAPLPLA